MSKGSKNTFLPIYFGVLGIGALGLGYLAYSASDSASTAESEHKLALKELDRLEAEPLSRTEDNAKQKKVLVDAYLAKVADLNTYLRKYQTNPTDAADSQSFQKKLQKFAADVNKTAKEKNVTLPAKFDFGMGKYLAGDFQNVPANAFGPLSANLDALNFITSAAMSSGVRSVDSMSREEIAAEKEAPATPAPGARGSSTANTRPANRPAATTTRPASGTSPKKAAAPLLDEGKVLERQVVRMAVTGKHQSITALLEALANTSPEKDAHFVTIRNLRIENEVKTGTSRTLEVKEEEIKPEGQPPYIKDAVYVLGNQAVKAYLDMDIIRFKDDESPAKPGDPKPAAGTDN